MDSTEEEEEMKKSNSMTISIAIFEVN